MRTLSENKPTSDPRYHNTWKLLKRYRDVTWSMESSLAYLKNEFQMEYECSVEEYLESLYVAGADLRGTRLEDHARCIERSSKMINLLKTSVDLVRTRHNRGEEYYWILYYTYLSPQEYVNTEEIIDQLRPHIHDISERSYFRKRQKAVETLSNVLWGYTAKESMDILEQFYPDELPTGIKTGKCLPECGKEEKYPLHSI